MITKEQREYLDKLAISAIKDLKKCKNKGEKCFSCSEKGHILYVGNRIDLLLPRCRLCNLKRVLQFRFGDFEFKTKIYKLTINKKKTVQSI